MAWHGQLDLNYRKAGDQTLAHDRHEGPLRVLQRLYPEGPGVCHHVLVHPPGGIVGGDELNLDAQLAPGSHALLTTPGATRFYRSSGPVARQSVQATLADGARLEWLPLETLAYRSCVADNHLRFDLAPGAEMMGWDILALGLPAAGEPFDAEAPSASAFSQCIELPGVWLERGTLRATDKLLLDSPLGLAGHRVMATMWFSAGHPIGRVLRDALLDDARQVGSALAGLAVAGDAPSGTNVQATMHWGATSPHERIVVLRGLAGKVEPVMQHLIQVWSLWRQRAWQLSPCPPRVWRT
jgi:urease accessory protein